MALGPSREDPHLEIEPFVSATCFRIYHQKGGGTPPPWIAGWAAGDRSCEFWRRTSPSPSVTPTPPSSEAEQTRRGLAPPDPAPLAAGAFGGNRELNPRALKKARGLRWDAFLSLTKPASLQLSCLVWFNPQPRSGVKDLGKMMNSQIIFWEDAKWGWLCDSFSLRSAV